MNNKKRLCTLIALFMALIVHADERVCVNGIYYIIRSDRTAWVTSQKGHGVRDFPYNSANVYKGHVVIPSTITYYGMTFTVTGIDACAFRHGNENKKLISVVMPNTIKEIDYQAFCYCTALQTVKLSENLENIGSNCFRGCTSLTKITIPNSVRRIQDQAFEGCTSLKSISLSQNLRYIGERCFCGCESLTKIVIPDSVQRIYKNSFWGCRNLKDIQYNENITIVETDAVKGIVYEGPITQEHYLLYPPTPIPTPTKNLASLTWMNFKSNTQQKDYSFKICVESQSKIEEVKVYINGVIERGIVPVLDDGCDMTIARNITLVEGDNVLKVVVKNAAGEAQVERTVTYAKQRTEKTITPPAPPQTQPKRIALVMGNAAYQYANPLVNPVHDADGIASKLRQLGFTVIVANNRTHEQMDQAIDEFSLKAKGYDVVLFYYAGHGVQVDGENYLIPVDANLKDKTAAKYRCVNMNEVLERMEDSECPLKIVILDACRNNPFRGWRMTGDDGFSSMSVPTGTCIVYSTSPGKTASDGPGMNNSPYTAAIIKLLDTPGLKLSDFFDKVRKEVLKTTNNQQHSWISGSYDNDFYFNPQK